MQSTETPLYLSCAVKHYLPDKLTYANNHQHNTNFTAVHSITTMFMIGYHQEWKYLYEDNKEEDLEGPRLQINTM